MLKLTATFYTCRLLPDRPDGNPWVVEEGPDSQLLRNEDHTHTKDGEREEEGSNPPNDGGGDDGTNGDEVEEEQDNCWNDAMAVDRHPHAESVAKAAAKPQEILSHWSEASLILISSKNK